MRNPFKKKPRQPVVNYESEVNFYSMGFQNRDAVEEIMKQLIDHEYLTTSPTTGEYMSAIRMADVYRVLCDYYDVNPQEPEYSDYVK